MGEKMVGVHHKLEIDSGSDVPEGSGWGRSKIDSSLCSRSPPPGPASTLSTGTSLNNVCVERRKTLLCARVG